MDHDRRRAAKENVDAAIAEYCSAIAAAEDTKAPGLIVGWTVGIALQQVDTDPDNLSETLTNVIFEARLGTDLFQQRGLADPQLSCSPSRPHGPDSPAMKVCAEPGCPTLVANGRCRTHEQAGERQRGTRQQRGYDAAHDRRRGRCSRPAPCEVGAEGSDRYRALCTVSTTHQAQHTMGPGPP